MSRHGRLEETAMTDASFQEGYYKASLSMAPHRGSGAHSFLLGASGSHDGRNRNHLQDGTREVFGSLSAGSQEPGLEPRFESRQLTGTNPRSSVDTHKHASSSSPRVASLLQAPAPLSATRFLIPSQPGGRDGASGGGEQHLTPPPPSAFTVEEDFPLQSWTGQTFHSSVHGKTSWHEPEFDRASQREVAEAPSYLLPEPQTDPDTSNPIELPPRASRPDSDHQQFAAYHQGMRQLGNQQAAQQDPILRWVEHGGPMLVSEDVAQEQQEMLREGWIECCAEVFWARGERGYVRNIVRCWREGCAKTKHRMRWVAKCCSGRDRKMLRDGLWCWGGYAVERREKARREQVVIKRARGRMATQMYRDVLLAWHEASGREKRVKHLLHVMMHQMSQVLLHDTFHEWRRRTDTIRSARTKTFGMRKWVEGTRMSRFATMMPRWCSRRDMQRERTLVRQSLHAWSHVCARSMVMSHSARMLVARMRGSVRARVFGELKEQAQSSKTLRAAANKIVRTCSKRGVVGSFAAWRVLATRKRGWDAVGDRIEERHDRHMLAYAWQQWAHWVWHMKRLRRSFARLWDRRVKALAEAGFRRWMEMSTAGACTVRGLMLGHLCGKARIRASFGVWTSIAGVSAKVQGAVRGLDGRMVCEMVLRGWKRECVRQKVGNRLVTACEFRRKASLMRWWYGVWRRRVRFWLRVKKVSARCGSNSLKGCFQAWQWTVARVQEHGRKLSKCLRIAEVRLVRVVLVTLVSNRWMRRTSHVLTLRERTRQVVRVFSIWAERSTMAASTVRGLQMGHVSRSEWVRGSVAICKSASQSWDKVRQAKRSLEGRVLCEGVMWGWRRICQRKVVWRRAVSGCWRKTVLHRCALSLSQWHLRAADKASIRRWVRGYVRLCRTRRTVFGWQQRMSTTRQKIRHRECCKRLVLKRKRQFVGLVFAHWRGVSDEGLSLARKEQKVEEMMFQSTMHAFLSAWRLRTKAQQARALGVSWMESRCDGHILSRALEQLTSYAQRRKAFARISQRALRMLESASTKESFTAWQKLHLRSQRIRRLSRRVMQDFAKRRYHRMVLWCFSELLLHAAHLLDIGQAARFVSKAARKSVLRARFTVWANRSRATHCTLIGMKSRILHSKKGRIDPMRWCATTTRSWTLERAKAESECLMIAGSILAVWHQVARRHLLVAQKSAAMQAVCVRRNQADVVRLLADNAHRHMALRRLRVRGAARAQWILIMSVFSGWMEWSSAATSVVKGLQMGHSCHLVRVKESAGLRKSFAGSSSRVKQARARLESRKTCEGVLRGWKWVSSRRRMATRAAKACHHRNAACRILGGFHAWLRRIRLFRGVKTISVQGRERVRQRLFASWRETVSKGRMMERKLSGWLANANIKVVQEAYDAFAKYRERRRRHKTALRIAYVRGSGSNRACRACFEAWVQRMQDVKWQASVFRVSKSLHRVRTEKMLQRVLGLLHAFTKRRVYMRHAVRHQQLHRSRNMSLFGFKLLAQYARYQKVLARDFEKAYRQGRRTILFPHFFSWVETAKLQRHAKGLAAAVRLRGCGHAFAALAVFLASNKRKRHLAIRTTAAATKQCFASWLAFSGASKRTRFVCSIMSFKARRTALRECIHQSWGWSVWLAKSLRQKDDRLRRKTSRNAMQRAWLGLSRHTEHELKLRRLELTLEQRTRGLLVRRCVLEWVTVRISKLTRTRIVHQASIRLLWRCIKEWNKVRVCENNVQTLSLHVQSQSRRGLLPWALACWKDALVWSRRISILSRRRGSSMKKVALMELWLWMVSCTRCVSVAAKRKHETVCVIWSQWYRLVVCRRKVVMAMRRARASELASWFCQWVLEAWRLQAVSSQLFKCNMTLQQEALGSWMGAIETERKAREARKRLEIWSLREGLREMAQRVECKKFLASCAVRIQTRRIRREISVVLGVWLGLVTWRRHVRHALIEGGCLLKRITRGWFAGVRWTRWCARTAVRTSAGRLRRIFVRCFKWWSSHSGRMICQRIAICKSEARRYSRALSYSFFAWVSETRRHQFRSTLAASARHGGA